MKIEDAGEERKRKRERENIFIYLLYENVLATPQGRCAPTPRKETGRNGKGSRHRGRNLLPKPVQMMHS